MRVLRSDLHRRTHTSGLRARIKQAVDGAFAHGAERYASARSEKNVTFSQICITYPVQIVCRLHKNQDRMSTSRKRVRHNNTNTILFNLQCFVGVLTP